MGARMRVLRRMTHLNATCGHLRWGWRSLGSVISPVPCGGAGVLWVLCSPRSPKAREGAPSAWTGNLTGTGAPAERPRHLGP